MRKMLIILLVAGLLIGIFCAVESFDEISDGKHVSFDGEDYIETTGDPAPCGGEGGGGSGGGLPG